jgi:hypothetical protein
MVLNREVRGVFGLSKERSWLRSSAVKKLGVRFDGAKRDYGQSSHRLTIPASPSRDRLLPECQRYWAGVPGLHPGLAELA